MYRIPVGTETPRQNVGTHVKRTGWRNCRRRELLTSRAVPNHAYLLHFLPTTHPIDLPHKTLRAQSHSYLAPFFQRENNFCGEFLAVLSQVGRHSRHSRVSSETRVERGKFFPPWRTPRDSSPDQTPYSGPLSPHPVISPAPPCEKHPHLI